MLERVCKDVENYIGKFIEADKNNFIGVWREYFRICVRIQVEVPLKRRMKIKKAGGEWFWVNFKYEHVPTFCFICGLLGHAEKFCSKIFEMPMQEIVKPYGPLMKAMPRRQSYLTGSKWLRTGSSSQYTVGEGGSNRNVTGMEREGSGNLGTGRYNPKIKENETEKEGKSAGDQEFTNMEKGNG